MLDIFLEYRDLHINPRIAHNDQTYSAGISPSFFSAERQYNRDVIMRSTLFADDYTTHQPSSL